MSKPTETTSEFLSALRAWQQGEADRDTLVGLLTRLGSEQGDLVQQLIRLIIRQAAAQAPAGGENRDTDRWREELLACRARAWASPASAGLLVGPTVLILTDGQQGALLSPSGTRPLASSVSASLLLLCQTIVLADDAVEAQELGRLRQQRIEATSTSLSQIKPVS